MTIATFEEVYASLPVEYHDEKTEKDLRRSYDYIIQTLNRYAEHAVKPSLHLGLFYKAGGSQIILEASASDLNKPNRNEYNWHLQNTSQWLFACGLLYDTERKDFSLHT